MQLASGITVSPVVEAHSGNAGARQGTGKLYELTVASDAVLVAPNDDDHEDISRGIRRVQDA
jgi:hypothetical protein